MVVGTCTVHGMHWHCIRYLLLFMVYMLCIHTMDDTCCIIHACSLYLYVVRFITCQMVYLILVCCTVYYLPDGVSDPFLGQCFQVLQRRDGAMWLSWGKVKSSAV